jgi:hypothetical protein
MLMSAIGRLRERWRVRRERLARLNAARYLPSPDPDFRRAGEGGTKADRLREQPPGGG